MAYELGAFGITVNAVAPGLVISSANTRKLWEGMSPDAKSAYLQTTFMRRVGEIDDVANAVLFFASARTSWISGQILSVDGGTR
jgi:NAD(P)-dependent dehydrogenase (short-subunit alcohol dehydrogenase family)